MRPPQSFKISIRVVTSVFAKCKGVAGASHVESVHKVGSLTPTGLLINNRVAIVAQWIKRPLEQSGAN